MRKNGAVASLLLGISMMAAPVHDAVARTLLSPRAKAPPSNRTILITAHDFAFTGIPARIPAGWVTIRMANAGKELHMFASASVPSGMTATQMIDSILQAKNLKGAQEWGGPNAVAPGDTSAVTLFLPAGNYVVGCFVVSPDGKIHAVKGMITSFAVVADHGAGAPPPSDRGVVLSTYHIAMTGGPITRGLHTFQVRNAAKEAHDLVILKVLPGHSVDQALEWFRNPPVGKPAAVPIAGTTVLHTDEKAYIPVRFAPGTYVLVCWLSTNGKSHIQLGMKQVFTVPAS